MVLLCNPFMFLWQTPPSCCWSKNSSAVGLGLHIEVSCPVSWVFLQWNKINAIEWLWHQFYKGCCLIQSISEGLLVLKSHGGSVVYQDVLPAFGDAEHTNIRSDFLFDSQLQETWDSKGLEGCLCPWCIFLDTVSLDRVILRVGKSIGTSHVSFWNVLLLLCPRDHPCQFLLTPL